MTAQPEVTRSAPRGGGLRRLFERAPTAVGLIAGALMMVVGIFIVTRPLTALWVLAIYIGLSAIASGILEIVAPRPLPRGWRRALATVWIAGGVLIIVVLGRNLDVLPQFIALLLVLGGLSAFVDVTRGRASERVLAAASGIAQIAFGVLSFLWPDVTLLVVAVIFGVRTIIVGAVLVLRASRRARGRGPRLGDNARTRRARAWADAARYALAAVLIAVAAASWGVNNWLADGTPVIDAFYDSPEEVPDDPGVLIREDAYTGRTPPDADVRRILYTTTDAYGRSAVASGLVIRPTTPYFGPRPVVIWNHGTTGVARGCAPSLADASATRWAIPALNEALERGWVVVASDYSGQGAEGVFPYLIGKGEARSALDAARAAYGMDGMWLSDDVAVWGHSQGGHAALWTSQIAPEYAPELTIVGTVAISPAADPLALAQELTSSDASALLSVLTSWVLVPYADTYPDVHVDDYVAPGGRSIVREMTQRCPTEPGVIVSVLAALGVSADVPLYDADLSRGALGKRLAENTPRGPWETPLLIAWGAQDEVIPRSLYEGYVEELCESGQSLRWIEYRSEDHTGMMLPGSYFLPAMIAWTSARFAGEPQTDDDCLG